MADTASQTTRIAAPPDRVWAIAADVEHYPEFVPLCRSLTVRSRSRNGGKDVIVAQPDTGITPHVELVGVAFVPGFDVIDEDNDAITQSGGGGPVTVGTLPAIQRPCPSARRSGSDNWPTSSVSPQPTVGRGHL